VVINRLAVTKTMKNLFNLAAVGITCLSIFTSRHAFERLEATSSKINDISQQTSQRQNPLDFDTESTKSSKPDSVSNKGRAESTQSLSSMERWVYEQMNNHRAAKGLPPLVLDDWLTMQAREHSQAMSSDKVPFDRQSLQQRNQEIMNAGSYQGVSTIIGMTQGYINPAQANVSNWLKDGDVNLTSIEGEYKLTGVGVAMNLRGEYYFTQVFLR